MPFFPNISEWLTRDNITLFLAVFGAVGSAISGAYMIATHRRNVIMGVLQYGFNKDFYVFELMLENRSRLPIALTKISIATQGQFFDCSYANHTISETVRKRGAEVVHTASTNSSKPPINLQPLESKSCFICFDTAPQISSTVTTTVTFQVCTNRGRLKQMTLQLPPAGLQH